MAFDIPAGQARRSCIVGQRESETKGIGDVAVWTAALGAGLVALLCGAPRDMVTRRLQTITLAEPAAPAEAGKSGLAGPRDSSRIVAVRPRSVLHTPAVGAVCTAVIVATVLGGAFGVVCGVGAGIAVRRVLGRWVTAGADERRRRLAASLPLATELLAACMASGALPTAAATAVADATGGPLATELRRVVAALRLGGDPVASWFSLGGDDVLEPLGAAFSRSAASGAPLAAVLSDLAADLRTQQRLAAESEARRVGIRAAAPLGLCFLPAFILLGLVPIVAGLVGGLRV